jgi:hypothetical protein
LFGFTWRANVSTNPATIRSTGRGHNPPAPVSFALGEVKMRNILLWASLIIIGFFIIRIFISSRQLSARFADRRMNITGFPFVLVNSDGSARELTAEEQSYLSKTFEPFDSGRPYIKPYYEYLAPGGSMKGFLPKKQLPEHINIGPAVSTGDAQPGGAADALFGRR